MKEGSEIMLILLAAGVLQIILFFKLWVMTNNVQKLAHRIIPVGNKLKNPYLCGMEKDLSIAELVLPEGILDWFEVVAVQRNEKDLHIFLDELPQPPSDGGHYNSQGFTEQAVIQDFPLRGKPVFLHIRRRKWLNMKTKEVTTSKFDLTHLGTQLSKEFTAFLKRGISNPKR